MSAISLLSYILIFFIYFLNGIKRISSTLSFNLFYIAIFCYIGFSLYFTDISSHYLFPVFLTLIGVSYFTIFITSSRKNGSSNLFINTAQLLIPVYLITSTSYLEQFGQICLLEMVRVVADSGRTERRSEYTFINFISVSHRLVFLFIAMVIFYVIMGNISNIGIIKVENPYILIPISLSFMISCSQIGIINSEVVERINLQKYKSRNLLAYNYIYQFLIPFVLLLNIKIVLGHLSLSIYNETLFLMNVIFIIAVIINIKNYLGTSDKFYKQSLLKNNLLLYTSYIFIISTRMGRYEYLLVCTLIIILSNIKFISLAYKVKFKNFSNNLLNFIFFLTPISPFFYFLLTEIRYLENNKTFLGLMTILSIMFFNNEILRENKKLKIKKVNKTNKYANQRKLYLVVGAILNIIAIYYAKI